MARTRIVGKGLTFKFGAADFKCDLISAVLERGDAPDGGTDSVVTFCDAAASSGGQVWKLGIEAVQSTDSASATDGQSLHTLIWDTAAGGGGDVAFEFAPFGNATATADQPHYTGSIVVPAGGYPSVGGSAGDNSFTWSAEWLVKDNSVTKVVA